MTTRNLTAIDPRPFAGTIPAIRPKPKGGSTNTRHLTVAEVCDELRIARSTFYDWRAKRKAPRCIKLPNGDLRIRRSDFDAWLASFEEAA